MDIKFSKPSKMPCPAWGIPASTCKTGSKYAKVKGSVCSHCYAQSGAYLWSNVKSAYFHRLEQYNEGRNAWINTMIKKLKRMKNSHYRWFDSGDLQSLQMLSDIVFIAKCVPTVKFWLPTKELGILNDYIRLGFKVPKNLTIRYSSPMIDKKASIKLLTSKGIRTCGTITSADKTGGVVCPVTTIKDRKNCGDCRKCWDRKIPHVDYVLH